MNGVHFAKLVIACVCLFILTNGFKKVDLRLKRDRGMLNVIEDIVNYFSNANTEEFQFIDSGTQEIPALPTHVATSCGISVAKQTAQRRIVGGDDAGFGSFPWQAYIRIGSSRCNSLITLFEILGWKQCWIER